VTRKITRSVARIKAGLEDTLFMGNIDAARDWGYAPEYVEAMWRMLQQDEPTEVDSLIGNPSKAAEILHWKPEVLPPELAVIMVDADVLELGMERPSAQ